MREPEAFAKFSRQCQHEIDTGEPRDVTIGWALAELTLTERTELRTYLRELIDSELSDGELIHIWTRHGANFVYFNGMRLFFGELVRKIDALPVR